VENPSRRATGRREIFHRAVRAFGVPKKNKEICRLQKKLTPFSRVVPLRLRLLVRDGTTCLAGLRRPNKKKDITLPQPALYWILPFQSDR
jgi:hypothetical protein